MKNNNRVLPVLGVAAVLTAAVPSPSAAATDAPREPRKAPTGDTSVSPPEQPLLGTMLQFVADSIETEATTPGRPPEPPGQNNPPNPPGKTPGPTCAWRARA